MKGVKVLLKNTLAALKWDMPSTIKKQLDHAQTFPR
jgi:hypothetical protein